MHTERRRGGWSASFVEDEQPAVSLLLETEDVLSALALCQHEMPPRLLSRWTEKASEDPSSEACQARLSAISELARMPLPQAALLGPGAITYHVLTLRMIPRICKAT